MKRENIAQEKLAAFCEQLSSILLEAGRTHASCMVSRNGPAISFAKWTEQKLKEHSYLFGSAEQSGIRLPKPRKHK